MTAVSYFNIQLPNLKFHDQTSDFGLIIQSGFTPPQKETKDLFALIEHLDIIQESRELIKKGQFITWKDFVKKNES
ncbi:MAG TPA: hypothetical protein VMW41_01005 [Candidatus Bathyarchaeia archaeon]|nr:hypothetical protein [Candidatus Bathyarchaeia archaeon]